MNPKQGGFHFSKMDTKASLAQRIKPLVFTSVVRQDRNRIVWTREQYLRLALEMTSIQPQEYHPHGQAWWWEINAVGVLE